MKRTLIAVLLAAGVNAWSQGTFQNLGFEAAKNIPVFDPQGHPWTMPIADALPGWTDPSIVLYNDVAISSAAVSLHAVTSPSFQPLQGNYSVALIGSSWFLPPQSAAIAQTGQIPQDAKSLLFLAGTAPSSYEVSFSGQALSVIQIGSTPNYVTMAGDISAFAGQTGELRFNGLPATGPISGRGLFLDNIQFSNQPIPEPSTYALAALGLLALHFNRRRNPPRLTTI